MVKDFRSISSQKLDWQIIVPNEKADWINQRDGVFDNLIPLAPEKKKERNAKSVFNIYSAGVMTNREFWVFNSSKQELKVNIRSSIDYFNSESKRYIQFVKSNSNIGARDFVSSDATRIKWDSALYADAESGKELTIDDTCFIKAIYRPYFKQHLYFNKDLNWSRCLQPLFFPNSQCSNIVICINGAGTNKDFCTLISDCVFDRQTLANNQCFPLYWYEENKNPQASLFDDTDADKFIRRDGITDWILKEVRSRFGGSRAITKEHIFYYVYGLLHSKQYRERFADDLKNHCLAFLL